MLKAKEESVLFVIITALLMQQQQLRLKLEYGTILVTITVFAKRYLVVVRIVETIGYLKSWKIMLYIKSNVYVTRLTLFE